MVGQHLRRCLDRGLWHLHSLVLHKSGNGSLQRAHWRLEQLRVLLAYDCDGLSDRIDG
jgi:hypothetical protein